MIELSFSVETIDKKRKDFYQINIDIIKEVIKSCNQLTLKFKKKINKSTKKISGGATTTNNNNDNIFLYIQKK